MNPAETFRSDVTAPSSTLGRIGAGIARIADVVTSLMFAGVFVIFCYKIARRYLPPQDAVAWADEVSVILFIWIVFIANGYLMDERRQITFDLIHRHLSPPSQRRMEIARMMLVGGLFLVSAFGAFDYIRFLWRERTPVLQWRLDIIYICFGLYMLAIIVRYAVRIAELALNRKL
jgi:TRAP-type C4-dicarboxylate transport system permease small subunit